jgi:hypothetical protein
VSPVRLVAVCFSTATLLFSAHIATLTHVKNRFYNQWQRGDTVALIVVVLAVTALAVGLARLALTRGGPGSRRLLRWILVLALVEVGLGYLLRIPDDPGRWLRWGVPAVTLPALLVGLILAERWIYRAAVIVALVLSPLGLILFWQLLATPSVDLRASVPGPARVPADRPPIVLVIFDDWSRFRSTADGAFLPSLPNLRALADSSFRFDDARSPGPHTVESIPQLIAQSPTLPWPADDPWWMNDGPTAADAPEPRLFTRAAAAGYATRLIGFYLPYRELVGETVPEVFTAPHESKGETFAGTMGLAVARSLEKMGDPATIRVGWWFDERAYNRHWYAMNLGIRARVMETLADLDPGTLLLAHFALPHSPFVFSADGAYRGGSVVTRMEVSPAKYAEHLRYVDRLVGEMVALLRARGSFDDTMLILTSDHNWTMEPEEPIKERRTEVPLIVKWPGQREGAVVSTRICLAGLQALLDPVQNDSVTVVQSAATLDEMARRSCA